MRFPPVFTAREQTRAQRQFLVDRATARMKPRSKSLTYQLCQRYVAGELSLAQVIAEVEHIHRSRFSFDPCLFSGSARREDAPAGW